MVSTRRTGKRESRRGPRVYWRCIRDGVVGGVLGGAALIAFFFVYDLIRLEPFATPVFVSGSVLGGAPLDGGTGLLTTLRLAAFLQSAVRIASYALVHLFVFALLGVGAAFSFEWAGVPRRVLSGALYGLLVCTLLFYAIVALTSGDLAGTPDWRAVLLGNLVAGGVMGAYLHRREVDGALERRRLSRRRLYGGDELV